VFVVAVDARLNVARYTTRTPNSQWVPPSLANAAASLRPKHQDLWRWWDLPAPEEKWLPLSKILEAKPTCVEWHSAEETRYISSLMNETSSANLEAARRSTGRLVGFMYKRMREGKQRAEVRFDGLSGCLRTPKGGSSRQTVIIVESGVVKSRLLSPREAARLMGVPDSFVLPPKYNDAYKAMADGVAIPVVQWLSSHLLEPLVRLSSSGRNKMVTRRPLRQITTARPAASSRVSKLPNGKVAPTPAPSG
jgi:DNA (cytosine-5)-methyltransferase 1